MTARNKTILTTLKLLKGKGKGERRMFRGKPRAAAVQVCMLC